MNHENNMWEARLDKALKNLPELQAPASLARNVMAQIALRSTLKWYQKPWQMWSRPLQVVSFAVLSIGCAGFAFAAWQLGRAAGFNVAMEEVRHLFSGVAVLWNAFQVLGSALLLVVKHLGNGFVLTCLASLGLGYLLCVGLGTVYVKLAFARR